MAAGTAPFTGTWDLAGALLRRKSRDDLDSVDDCEVLDEDRVNGGSKKSANRETWDEDRVCRAGERNASPAGAS